ncbi:MAG TPA: cell division protein FtsZ [Verrucomicrobiae bacterium]|nr:cell division protein FtsZ [Verrucomicrobiae bacterium]
MIDNSPTASPGSSTPLRLFGIGDAGIATLELLLSEGVSPESCIAINSGGPALENSRAQTKLPLELRRLRGLGSGGDPERGRQAAEEKTDELKAICLGAEVVFIIAGLGGGSGGGISPVVARVAKAAGALVLGFVSLPFDCEGSRRQGLAEESLEQLREAADGVVVLPNQKIFKLIEENTTVMETFRITSRLLADGVQGLWRLFSRKGLIEIPTADLVDLLQDRNCQSFFAVAEAAGQDRASKVLDKLLAHPLLDNGEALCESENVLVSLTGGPGLTMAEVSRVMDHIKSRCAAPLTMGAYIEEQMGDRLAVTLVCSIPFKIEGTTGPRAGDLHSHLLDRKPGAKPTSRFVPPAPALAPEQVEQLLSKQARTRPNARSKALSRMRQTHLPLEIVSKGRFDKSEPTIHKGEDLDVPTYIRRGVPLN